MAITFQEHFDGPNGVALSTVNTGFDTVQSPPIFSTAINKSGTASARYTTTGSYSYVTRSFTSTTVRYWSFYIRPTVSPSANTVLLFIGSSSDSADRKFQVTLNTTRTVKMQQGAAAIIIGSATASTCPLNEWSRIDLSYNNGTITLALYPGNANCDKAVGTALNGDTSSATITNDAFSFMSLGVVNGATNDFYVDEFREDNAALPGPLVASGGLTPYLYYDNGSTWTDVTQNLWYDNGQSWFQIEGGAISSGEGGGYQGLAAFGDSMTYGFNAGGPPSAWPAVCGARIGLPVLNSGVSSQTSTEVAIRQGGLTPSFNVAGGNIPASGSVNLTLVAPTSQYATKQWTWSGALGGVDGTLTKDAANSWTFARTAGGSAVAVGAGVEFHSIYETTHDDWIQVLWSGRNNATSSIISRDTAAMVDIIQPVSAKRYLVFSVCNMSNEPSGSNGYNTVLSINAALSSTYGSRYVDVRSWLINNGLSAAGITPTSQDATDIANDVIPISIRSDTIHLNEAGQAALGERIAVIIQQKGWV